MPECSVHLTHAVTYLSLSVKSNALYMAYEKAKKDALETLSQGVPLHLRNAPTKLMKDLNYGKGYQYAHEYADKLTTMTCSVSYTHLDVYKRQPLASTKTPTCKASTLPRK